MTGRRSRRRASIALFGSLLLVGRVAAHGAGLSETAGRTLAVPTWLFLLTGGAIIGASFLLASFVTDRAFVRRVHEWHRLRSVPVDRWLVRTGRIGGIVVLGFVLLVGLVGPVDPLSNAAVLLVWTWWWSGYTVSTYAFGNTWPVLNPWRTLAGALPSLERHYPARLDAWPSVAGLLALVWVEVVSPVSDQPRFLAGVVLAYTVVTLAGAVVFGASTWFSTVDPVARVFRYFGRVAPLARDGDGRFRLSLPASSLVETRLVTTRAEVGFVVAVLWVTTYDGLVGTPLWRDYAVTLVEGGVPPTVLYAGVLVAGYLFFLGLYAGAVLVSKHQARTYVSSDALARRFAPPLLAIAAGYHAAHFLGYFLATSPALLGALAAPLSPPAPVVAVLPTWFGGLELAFVLVGHLLAIWVAHAVAYDVFPGKLQAIRSQYAIVAVMVCYTMGSLWIVSQPYTPPPFVA